MLKGTGLSIAYLLAMKLVGRERRKNSKKGWHKRPKEARHERSK